MPHRLIDFYFVWAHVHFCLRYNFNCPLQLECVPYQFPRLIKSHFVCVFALTFVCAWAVFFRKVQESTSVQRFFFSLYTEMHSFYLEFSTKRFPIPCSFSRSFGEWHSCVPIIMRRDNIVECDVQVYSNVLPRSHTALPLHSVSLSFIIFKINDEPKVFSLHQQILNDKPFIFQA